MLANLELWKLAVDKSPDACAIVTASDQFIYANLAWCRMLGFSEAELLEKRWQDITASEDVGADQRETDDLRSGKTQDYYLEKVYVRKNGTRLFVALYVHRYPVTGDVLGYVAFAKALSGGREYEELRERFTALEQVVSPMRHNEVTLDRLSDKIDHQHEQIEQSRQLILSLAQRDGINIGDRVSGDGNQSRVTNEAKVMISIVGAVGFLCTVLISIAAVVAYVAYTSANNPNLTPPQIEQHIVGGAQKNPQD